MSKFTITHLKAPWPSGAKVGDVIELAHVPAWALGKCSPATDDAEATVSLATVEFVANVPPADVQQEAVVGVDVTHDEALQAVQENGDVIEVTDSSSDSVEFVKATSRDEMEVEAKALGVSFNARTSDETLTERIIEAKAKQA
jgi:hypothetical protein